MAKKKSERIRLKKGRYLVRRGEVWYLEECVGGKQTRRSLGTEDHVEATRRATDERGWPLPATEKVLPPAAPKDVSKALGTLIVEYLGWYRKTKRASGFRRVAPVIHWFVKSVGEMEPATAVTRDHVQRWIDSRVDGRSPVTVRNDFARVRAFLRWISGRKGVVDWNVCRGVERPKDDDVTREAPSVEKVRRVISALRKSDHAWIADFAEVLAETGMRPAELLGARGTDLRDKLLSIAPWEGRELKSKWSKRLIELNGAALTILKARVDAMFDRSKPIFGTELGTVYKPHSALHVFYRALADSETATVPIELRMSLYDFRHFFCSEHAAPGPQHMQIENLAGYIGHSPKSQATLLRWYTDQAALRRGAPVALISRVKTRVASMGAR